MKLYHGTNPRHLKRILRDGIKPRGRRKGNWKHTVDSHPDAVYLTVAYSLHYALCAKTDKEKDGLILEIDSTKLNPFRFCPDEDFLGHVSNGQDGYPKDIMERTAFFRDNLSDYVHLWEKSIEHMGNCCYLGTIPPEAITRYAIIPDIYQWVRWSDPTIHPTNYRILGDYYKALSASLFGDKTDYEPEGGFYQLPPTEILDTVKVVQP